MQAPSSNEPGELIAGATSLVAPVAPRRRRGLSGGIEPYLYLLPGFLVFTLFVAIPTVGSIILSLTAWNGVSWDTATFIGLDNYIKAITDHRFQIAFWHNIVLVPYFVLLPLVIGLVPAAVVHQLQLRGARWLQAGLFLPYIMPGVLIGVVWAWILNPIFGPVNKILKQLGFSPPTWLGDFTWALPTVGMIGAWAAYGFCYVIFIAGLQKIPSELYEAARLDGANTWHEFVSVTLPGLRREIAVVLSVNLINALRAFDIIKATTDGGPGDRTQVMALYMINTAFGSRQAGYGTAIAVLLAVITLVGSMLVLRLFGDDDD
ncbi:MAG TPA: sugar ABC transporter permease [Thermomicrobiales bacterium]|nr:sugar ABC transporter permease [Thermomicrobiales bacterium]